MKHTLHPRKGYIRRVTHRVEEVKIPESCVRCPECKGRGEMRLYWGSPWDRGQFRACPGCMGRGYIEEEVLQADRRFKANNMLDRFTYQVIFGEGSREEGSR